MKSWKQRGVDIERLLGFTNNPAKYVYRRANRFEVCVLKEKRLNYVGRFLTLKEALLARDQFLTH